MLHNEIRDIILTVTEYNIQSLILSCLNVFNEGLKKNVHYCDFILLNISYNIYNINS